MGATTPEERQAAATQAAKDYTRTLLAEAKPALAYLISYPLLRRIAREQGYALALHGSLARDFDLVAIPWTDEATDADALVRAICEQTDLTDTGRGATDKPHGRRCFTLKGVTGMPHGWVDLSVMPLASPTPEADRA